MKSTFIFALLALGSLICATKAAPSSSEMQQDDGDMKKLLELIDRAARSQQGDDDGDEKDSNAKLQDADELSEEQGDEEGDENGRDSILELMDRAARLQEEDDDGDDMKVKAQFFGFLKRMWNKHKHTAHRLWNKHKHTAHGLWNRHKHTIHHVAKHLINGGGENGGENGGDENGGENGCGENMKELAKLLDRVAKLQDEDDSGDRHRRQRRQIHAK